MDIEEINENMIAGIANSLNDGFDVTFKYVKMFYENDGGNDFFITSRAALETALFRLYFYQYFCKSKEVDLKRFVLEDAYYQQERQGMLKRWSEYMGQEMTGAIVYQMAEMAHNKQMPGRFFPEETEEREAAFWYWLAATMGDAQAMNNLGILYAEGKGVKLSKVMMHYWFLCGAKAFYPQAIRNIGLALKKQPLFGGENLEEIADIFVIAARDIDVKVMAKTFVERNTEILLDLVREKCVIYNNL